MEEVEMSRPEEDVRVEEQQPVAEQEAPAVEAEGASEQPAPETEPVAEAEPAPPAEPVVDAEAIAEADPAQMMLSQRTEDVEDTGLRAVVEAIVYITEEPVTVPQIAAALQCPEPAVQRVLDELTAEYARSEHGVMLREVAGGYKITTKPEHHEAIRAFVKSLKPPLKLSLAALETLATIAYKQPITAPEVQEIRGVQGTGVLKTLLDRKLIQASGRKNVIGRPILYKTTREFLVQFGLKDLAELPTLKEFEELRRLSAGESEGENGAPETPGAEQPVEQDAAAVESPAGQPSEEQPAQEEAPAAADAPVAETQAEESAPEAPATDEEVTNG